MKTPAAYRAHQRNIAKTEASLAALRDAIASDRAEGNTFQQIGDDVGLTKQRIMRILDNGSGKP